MIKSNIFTISTLVCCLGIMPFSVKAEDEFIAINCSNDKQKQCLAAEVPEITSSLCSDHKSFETYNLTSLASVKFPETSEASAPVTSELRAKWISLMQKNCQDELSFNSRSESSWTNQFMLGYTMQSNFNEEGEHLGLTEKRGFAQFGFEGRWMFDNYRALHWEIGGLLAGSPVKKEISEDSDPQQPNDADNPPSSDNTENDSVTFNDVSDSFDLYSKVSTSMFSFQEKKMKDYFTIGWLGGFKTREKITDDKDSVIFYTGPLLEYLYYGDDMRNVRNRIPRGKIWLAYLNFEEYGGVEHVNRLLLTGEWQLNQDAAPDKGRFVAGFKANVGSGADDVAIFFAYRSGFNAIQKFLTGS
ncbi:MAG: hypothetical protein HWE26_02325 [Alteromonadaceae bacterium]|nr:hypothetical protein [Alteromonadaceae bacterium]